MVKATELRKLLLESAVNPQDCPLLAEIVKIGTPDYFMIRAIEKVSEARRDPTNSHHVHACLVDATTSLALARGMLTNEPTKAARASRT